MSVKTQCVKNPFVWPIRPIFGSFKTCLFKNNSLLLRNAGLPFWEGRIRFGLTSILQERAAWRRVCGRRHATTCLRHAYDMPAT